MMGSSAGNADGVAFGTPVASAAVATVARPGLRCQLGGRHSRGRRGVVCAEGGKASISRGRVCRGRVSREPAVVAARGKPAGARLLDGGMGRLHFSMVTIMSAAIDPFRAHVARASQLTHRYPEAHLQTAMPPRAESDCQPSHSRLSHVCRRRRSCSITRVLRFSRTRFFVPRPQPSATPSP